MSNGLPYRLYMVMLCIVTDDGGGVGANDTRGGETVGVEAKIFGGRWHSI